MKKILPDRNRTQLECDSRLPRTMKSWVIVGLLLVLVACQPAPRAKNLILICIDTLRADLFLHPDLDDAFTPWIQQSMNYSQAYATAPWTVPSVASAFTGLYPIQHGAGEFSEQPANLKVMTPSGLSTGPATLAEIASNEGLATAMFSAHPWLKPGFGLDRGFEQTQFKKHSDGNKQAMLDWISGQAGNDGFLAYLHLMEVHDDHRAPGEKLAARFENLPESESKQIKAFVNQRLCKKPGNVRCLRNMAYVAATLQARQHMADLLETLSENGQLENTAVILYSDHGEAFTEHLKEERVLPGNTRTFFGTGHGQQLFQELMHVPVMAWLPGSISGTYEGLVSIVDLLPTAVQWLGLDYDTSALPGQPLPLSENVDDASRAIYASGIGYGYQQVTVVANSKKAMYWPINDEFRFYDLNRDPREKKPIRNDELELEFSTLVGDYLALDRYDSDPAPVPEGERLKELQSIGYLQGVEKKPADTENEDKE